MGPILTEPKFAGFKPPKSQNLGKMDLLKKKKKRKSVTMGTLFCQNVS